jgi:hypothetical protein
MVAHIWVIPNVTNLLVDRFAEFANERVSIQLYLTAPVVLTEFILLLIMYLIYLINREKMFTNSVYKWIWMLAGASFGLFVSLVAMYKWLDFIGALPPVVALFLMFSGLLSLAVSFVVLTMLGLLKKATQAARELEGVI